MYLKRPSVRRQNTLNAVFFFSFGSSKTGIFPPVKQLREFCGFKKS